MTSIVLYLGWSRGRPGASQIARLAASMARQGTGLCILVAHHPLLLTAAGEHRRLVERSALALTRLRKTGLDLALGGHVHLGYAGLADGVVVAQAGTVESSRLVGERNGCNLVTDDPDVLCVEHWRWQGHAYAPDGAIDFQRGEEGWLSRRA